MATCCHFRTLPRRQRATGGISSGSAGTWPATSSRWARCCWTWARGSRRSIRLEDLAVPYAAAICEHLQVEDRQSTSAQSRFLDACRSRNRGDLDAAQLAEVTARLGFANVIDAFHVSRGGQPTQTRFFIDERASRQGITLTDHLLELANGLQATVLPREVDARWNLVQMSWGLRLGHGWCRSR